MVITYICLIIFNSLFLAFNPKIQKKFNIFDFPDNKRKTTRQAGPQHQLQHVCIEKKEQ